MTVTAYSCYAIKYAHHDRLRSRELFSAATRTTDRCRWITSYGRCATRNARSWSTRGSMPSAARQRRREFLRCPSAGLKLLGVDALAVEDVIITHLHYDHVGNFDLFPAATFHLQDAEMSFATGRYMASAPLAAAFDVENVIGMVRELYRGRVCFHDGDAAFAPGISLHLVGGHTQGLGGGGGRRGVARSCSRRTPATILPTWTSSGRFPSSSTSAT